MFIQHQRIVASIFALLGTLSGARAGPEIVDLKGTPGGKQVAGLLAKLAQGNEGEGKLHSLTLNVVTGEVNGTGSVRHRHVWKYGPNWAPQHTTAYDWTWNGSFRFNAKNGTGHAVIDVGRGFKFDTRDFERALAGDFKPLLERALPNGGLTEKRFRNDYDTSKASLDRHYGAGNVYYASRRFVDWATPETAGEWAIRAVVTGGVDGSRIMAEVSRQASLEATDLALWLERRGVKEARSVASAILNGRPISVPELTLHWVTVGYYSRNFLAGNPVGPEVRVTHAAFALTWKGNPGGSPAQLDLRTTPAGAAVLKLFQEKSSKKNGTAELTRLNFDSRTGEVEGRVALRFRNEASREAVFRLNVRSEIGGAEVKLGHGLEVKLQQVRQAIGSAVR